MSDEAQCNKCSVDLTDDTRVHLWDGKDYCRDCVEDACPGLADYARDHPRLEEQFPCSGAAMLLRVWLFGLALLVIAILSPPGPPASRAEHVLVAVTTFVVVFCLLLPWLLLPRTYSVDKDAVIAQEGRLIRRYRFPYGWRRMFFWRGSWIWERCYDLGEGVSWHATKAWRTFYLAAPRLGATVIVVAVPRRTFLWIPLPRARIPCGWSLEMRKRWEGFLSLAAPKG